MSKQHKQKSQNLYDYLLHYNPHTEYWTAFKREDKDAYFNGTLADNMCIKHKDIKTLVSYINKL